MHLQLAAGQTNKCTYLISSTHRMQNEKKPTGSAISIGTSDHLQAKALQLVHLHILSARNPNNAHKNAQKISKHFRFISSLHYYGSAGTNRQ